jgi:hypothetical protein
MKGVRAEGCRGNMGVKRVSNSVRHGARVGGNESRRSWRMASNDVCVLGEVRLPADVGNGVWVWAWAHTPYHDAHADSGEADLVDGLLGAPHADGRDRREEELGRRVGG